MEKFLLEQLEDLKRDDLYREIKTAEVVGFNKVKIKNKELILFCNNDYLGLSQHEKVKKAFVEAAQKYGVGSGAARLISGSTIEHEQLEKALAKMKEKPKALLFSSGFLANLGVLSSITTSKDLILMDKLCHASLIDGAKLSEADMRVFPHLNYDRCEELLVQKGKEYERVFLVTESIFSMDGDKADLNRLIEFKKKYGAILIVDDAHGTGVLGQCGHGAHEDLESAGEIDFIIGTLSKALGCLGGYVASSVDNINYLINRARSFIFATSLPSAVCAAAKESVRLITDEPALKNKLWKNISHFHSELKKLGFEVQDLNSPIIPLIVGSERKALEMTEMLFNAGYWIPAIRYPTVGKGKARLRVTLNALHDFRQMDDLLKVLKVIKSV